MTSVVIDVPLMYADHHVVEVRRILFEIPGVEAVNASSAFQVVKIEYDPDKTSEDALKQILDENGYLGDLQVPYRFYLELKDAKDRIQSPTRDR